MSQDEAVVGKSYPPQQELGIATAIACGQPQAAVRLNYGLGRGELKPLLEQPHMVEMVEAKKAQLMATTTTLMAKTMLSAEHALDSIIAKSSDSQDRDSVTCSKYIVDKVLASAPQKVEVQANLSVDVEVLAELALGIGKLQERSFGDPTTPVAESRYLHSGAKVMEERDAAGVRKENGDGS